MSLRLLVFFYIHKKHFHHIMGLFWCVLLRKLQVTENGIGATSRGALGHERPRAWESTQQCNHSTAEKVPKYTDEIKEHAQLR